jgi:arylsulfatase A-like enzyme
MGGLSDLAPTILKLLKMQVPTGMTGKDLLATLIPGSDQVKPVTDNNLHN